MVYKNHIKIVPLSQKMSLSRWRALWEGGTVFSCFFCFFSYRLYIYIFLYFALLNIWFHNLFYWTFNHKHKCMLSVDFNQLLSCSYIRCKSKCVSDDYTVYKCSMSQRQWISSKLKVMFLVLGLKSYLDQLNHF